MNSGLKSLLIVTTIGILLIVAYSQTFGYGLVNYDDYEYLVRSVKITGGFSREGLAYAQSTPEHAIWMPLTWLSYMLDISLFGANCWSAMHIHCVLLHLVNMVLLFALFRIILKDLFPWSATKQIVWAGFVAAIWALHPLRVESVAWLSSRKDVLSLAFELSAMICWSSASRRKQVDLGFVVFYIAALLFFLLGAMAKPSVMTFPMLQAIVDLFVIRRLRPHMYIAAGIMMVAFGWEAAYYQSAGGATEDLSQTTLFFRLLNSMSAYGIYLTKTVIPLDLAPQCINRFPEMPRGVIAGVAISIGLAICVLRSLKCIWDKRAEFFVIIRDDQQFLIECRKDVGLFLVGVLFFTLGIGPFLGIAKFGYHAFADRFTYIPAIGLSFVFLSVFRSRARSAFVILPIIIAVLSVLTWKQVTWWRDDLTLWKHTIDVDGQKNAVAHSQLGLAAFEFSHDLDLACREFAKVRALSEPIYWGCVQIHVLALLERGDHETAADALEWYRKAVARYSAANLTEIDTPSGKVRVPTNLQNYIYTRLASELCDPKTRDAAAKEIDQLVRTKTMTPTLAYLVYRYADLTENKGLQSYALQQLEKSEKTDYLQFRYLTSKRSK